MRIRIGQGAALAVVGTAVLGLSAAASAQAAGLPACTAKATKLKTTSPGFGQIGKDGVYRVIATQRGRISGTFATVLSDEAPRFVPITLNRSSTRVRVPAPSTGEKFSVVIDWVQDAGTAAACHGQDRYVDQPLIAEDAKPGDPLVARIAGRYSLTFTPLNYAGAPVKRTWITTPRCDVFGCAADVRATGGLRGVLKPKLNGKGYTLTTLPKATPGSCGVTKTTGPSAGSSITIPNAFRVQYVYDLKVLTADDGPGKTLGTARRLSGGLTTQYLPTAIARAKGCTTVTTYRTRVTGRAL